MPEVKALNLRVPKRHIDSIALLLGATDAQFDAFERAIGQPTPPRNIRNLISDVAERAGWPQPERVDALAGLMVSLSAQLDSFPDATVEEFAASVAQAAGATEDEKLRATREQWNTFRDRLVRLLGPPSPLWLWAKAAVVLSEHERRFCDARILTDIRPIFGRRPADRAEGFSVLHTLKVTFHRGSEDTEELFVALDSDDLQILKRAILRAEEKQVTLETLVRGTGVPLLSPRN